MRLPQTYRWIKKMGREKPCNRNMERKTLNSKRQEFQHTSTKCHKSEMCIMRQYRARDKDCTEVKDPVKCRQIVSSKKLCFNCLKYRHRAADCPSCTCFKCNWKHHTSLCVNNQLQGKDQQRSRGKRKDDGFFWRKEHLLLYCDRQGKWDSV